MCIRDRPIASFAITNSEMTRYQALDVIDTSYDPYGGTITSWTWELYKGCLLYTSLQTIVVDELTLDLEANDVPSGVATFKMDGEVIFLSLIHI